MIQKAEPYLFEKSASDAGVWAAFCERTFEVGPTQWEVSSKVLKKTHIHNTQAYFFEN